jgi:HTH-type transcriptional regulator / antitoxin HigA
MKWNALITKSQYEKALNRKNEMFYTTPGSPEENEMILLGILIKDYEERHIISPRLYLKTDRLRSSDSLHRHAS